MTLCAARKCRYPSHLSHRSKMKCEISAKCEDGCVVRVILRVLIVIVTFVGSIALQWNKSERTEDNN